MRSAITGAFSYTGRYLAQRLLQQGHSLVNLTNHPKRAHGLTDDQLQRIETAPLDFNDTDGLARALEVMAPILA